MGIVEKFSTGASVRRLEDEHPMLTAAIGRVADALAALGI